MSATVTEIFRTAREIVDKGIVRSGITSVGVALYNVVLERAKDVLAPNGIVLTGGMYPIAVAQSRKQAESAHTNIQGTRAGRITEITTPGWICGIPSSANTGISLWFCAGTKA